MTRHSKQIATNRTNQDKELINEIVEELLTKHSNMEFEAIAKIATKKLQQDYNKPNINVTKFEVQAIFDYRNEYHLIQNENNNNQCKIINSPRIFEILNTLNVEPYDPEESPEPGAEDNNSPDTNPYSINKKLQESLTEPIVDEQCNAIKQDQERNDWRTKVKKNEFDPMEMMYGR